MGLNKYVINNYIKFIDNKIKELIDIHDISHILDYHEYPEIDFDRYVYFIEISIKQKIKFYEVKYYSFEDIIDLYELKIKEINKCIKFIKDINHILSENDIICDLECVTNHRELQYTLHIFYETFEKTGENIITEEAINPRYIKEYSAFKIQSVFRNYRLRKAQSLIKAWLSFILFRPGSWLMKKAERSFESSLKLITTAHPA